MDSVIRVWFRGEEESGTVINQTRLQHSMLLLSLLPLSYGIFHEASRLNYLFSRYHNKRGPNVTPIDDAEKKNRYEKRTIYIYLNLEAPYVELEPQYITYSVL